MKVNFNHKRFAKRFLKSVLYKTKLPLTIGSPKMRVEIFTLPRVALGHASSLLSLLLCHNNKLSRLDACPSAMREGKNFNTHFWAAYALTYKIWLYR